MNEFLITSAILWTGLRLFVWPGHKLTLWGTIEVFAHIWVGFVAAIIWYDLEHRSVAIWSLTIPSLVELVMAILFMRGWYVR